MNKIEYIQNWVFSTKKAIVFFIILGLLNGCSSSSTIYKDSGPDRDVDVSHVKNAVPKPEVITRAGNKTPYKVLGKTYRVNFNTKGFTQTGEASWYGRKFHGRKTSNGEVYDMYAMTAAHKTLPIPSYVRVTNVKNRRSVVVRVNDRGPFHGGRIIDLSYAAAKKLGIQQAGIGTVRVDIVEPKTALTQPNVKVSKSVKAQSQSSVGDQKTYLQVGAFRWRSGAIERQEKVARLLTHQVIVQIQGEPKIYKVLVGPIKSTEALRAIKAKLSQNKLSDVHVVKF